MKLIECVCCYVCVCVFARAVQGLVGWVEVRGGWVGGCRMDGGRGEMQRDAVSCVRCCVLS